VNKIAIFIVSLAGLGFLKPMPGTYASLATFLVAYPLAGYFNLTTAALVLLLLLLVSHRAIKTAILNEVNQDPAWIVIDEVLGVMLIVVLIPWSITAWLAAFILFRLFDAFKIWPVNIFDKIKTPFGVIADDLTAGAMTVIIIKLLAWANIF